MQPAHVVVLNWKDAAHPEAGGAEVYCANLARELARSGTRVTYVTSRPHSTPARERHNGYLVRRMGGTYTVYPLVLIWLLVNRRRIDAVIDSQNGIPFFSPLVLRARTAVVLLIHHVHQDQFDLYFSPLMAKVGRWLEGPASRRVYGRAAVCTVSPSTRTDVRRRLGLLGPIHVTPNGYRADLLTNTPRAAEPTIACVGRLVPHKRWNLLVDAVADLVDAGREVHLDLLGSGPEQAALQAQIQGRGMERWITLHGYVSDETRDRLLGRAWISACTSVGEGWGLSVIEAAGQGVPTVAIDVAGLRDSIRHDLTGWLTTPAALCEALGTALDAMGDRDTAKRIADSCAEWASALRWEWTADRFRGVLSAELKQAVRPAERRAARADSAVMITLSRTAALRIDPHMLRATDQLNFCRVCLDWCAGPHRIVLHGADEMDAIDVLSRLGLSKRDGAITVRLCRADDLVQWSVGTIPHNAPSLLNDRNCPTSVLPAQDPAAQRRIA